MTHYEDAQWMAFVHRLLRPHVRRAMETHLDSPCSPCSARMELLRKSAEQGTMSAGGLGGAALDKLRPIVAELLFDSAENHSTEGLQSRDGRHLLFGADTLHIDLLVEQEGEAQAVRITGQIFDHRRPSLPIDRPIPILLRGMDGPLALSFSNRQGGFLIACQHPPPAELCVLLEEERLASLPLLAPPSQTNP